MKFNFSNTSIGKLRLAGITEGISFLLLLFVAMPLKYFANLPEGVKITGWIHGLLFILYILALVNVKFTQGWSFMRTLIALVASLIPFGTFILDTQLRKEEKMVLAQLESKK
jgi:integral membrane protein